MIPRGAKKEKSGQKDRVVYLIRITWQGTFINIWQIILFSFASVISPFQCTLRNIEGTFNSFRAPQNIRLHSSMKGVSLFCLGQAVICLASPGSTVANPRVIRQGSSATVVEGNGTIQASLPSGDFVNVYLHGATITSWKASDGDDKLLLSTASALDGSAAIRGGIPVVFPNFGSPPKNHQTSELPSHGFARNSTWTFAGSELDDHGSGVMLTFTLNSTQLSASYQQDWPYSAGLTYTVNLTQDNLAVHFSVENTDTTDIDFQFLLHTYLSVPVSQVVLRCVRAV